MKGKINMAIKIVIHPIKPTDRQTDRHSIIRFNHKN